MTIDKDSPDKFFPLRYEDGPDYCTVKDARGKDFALTVQPDVLKEMESALRGAMVNSISHSRSSAVTEQEITSIVSRLRNFAIWNNRHSHYEPVPLCKEAADLIERIRAEPQESSNYRDLLIEVALELKRCRIFITSREKMHPDGVKLYDELTEHVDAALALSRPRMAGFNEAEICPRSTADSASAL